MSCNVLYCALQCLYISVLRSERIRVHLLWSGSLDGQTIGQPFNISSVNSYEVLQLMFLRLAMFSHHGLLCLCPLQYSKHLFVHIGQTNPSYSDPLLEAVDIRQIYDKFPEKKGGLKELYEKGPQNAFFLVKFWVGCCHHVIIY